MIRFICSLIIIIALTVSTQTEDYDTPLSPCPEVFTYEALGMDDQPLSKRWYGVIKLSTDVTLHAVWLNVILNRKADILGNWIGDVTTKDNFNFKIVNDELKIYPGEPKIVRFFIQYNEEYRPELKSILFNGREICHDSTSVINDTISKPNNQNINGVPIKTDIMKTMIQAVSGVTKDKFYNNSQIKVQNKQTTTSKPTYYVQPTTGKVKNDNSTVNVHIRNQTQSVSGNQWWPQNKTEIRQQTTSTPVKGENKGQSTPVVGRPQTVSQTWPQIKATVYQQALNDKSPSTETYTQGSSGHTKVDNNLPVTPVNKLQVINPGSYSSTSERYGATVSPNIEIKLEDKFQDYRPSITENYGQTNVGNNEQNSGVRDSNFQQGYLPAKQYTVPDSTQKKMITVNIQVPTNNRQRKPVATVPIQGINTEHNFNDERRDEAVGQQVKPVSKPTSAITWSNVPSELSYGSASSQLFKPNDERMDLNVRIQLPLHEHESKPEPELTAIIENPEDDEKYPFTGLPIYIPNIKPEEACGKVIKKSPQILPFGSSTSEGQWPWQAAIYQQQTVHFKYICGGTLVSHRHIITAAHCVTRRKSMRLVNQLTLTVYLGKFNLRTSVEGVQVMFVNKISVHPSYNSTIFSRDLAILELRDYAKFTPWVRPACLWPEDEISLNSIVGRTGSEAYGLHLLVFELDAYRGGVIIISNSAFDTVPLQGMQNHPGFGGVEGFLVSLVTNAKKYILREANVFVKVVSWGVESSGITQTELNLLEMPIVDQETCMSSYNLYERFSAAHTYCARYKDDNGICNGDSGGGMVFKKGNTWYLRGVVSISVTSQTDYHCDSNQYIIFTDVAKHLPWIMDHIDL